MISSAFFAANRAALMEKCHDGVLRMTAYSALQGSGDMAAPFRQEANFWYLTGIDEPDWQLIMAGNRSWLVAPVISDIHMIFEGGLQPDEARRMSGVDEVINKTEARALLAQLASNFSVAYGIDKHPHQKHFNFVPNPSPGQLWRQLKRQFTEVRDIRRDLARLRAIKQPIEIEAITRAIDITATAFTDVRRHLSELQSENQIEAEFTHAFRYQNATHAYDPIVATGHNACTLHYVANNDQLTGSDMVLIDIGARVDHYPADITRTYAVGVPTARQIAVHAAVVAAHKQIIRLLAPGLSFSQYQSEVDDIMKTALRSLGLMNHKEDYWRYFPHAISHGLGVDVHDSLGGFETFQPGMVLTVEPGIYIPEEGIGVRIEDDILITDSGHQNLSKALALDM